MHSFIGWNHLRLAYKAQLKFTLYMLIYRAPITQRCSWTNCTSHDHDVKLLMNKSHSQNVSSPNRQWLLLVTPTAPNPHKCLYSHTWCLHTYSELFGIADSTSDFLITGFFFLSSDCSRWTGGDGDSSRNLSRPLSTDIDKRFL